MRGSNGKNVYVGVSIRASTFLAMQSHCCRDYRSRVVYLVPLTRAISQKIIPTRVKSRVGSMTLKRKCEDGRWICDIFCDSTGNFRENQGKRGTILWKVREYSAVSSLVTRGLEKSFRFNLLSSRFSPISFFPFIALRIITVHFAAAHSV